MSEETATELKRKTVNTEGGFIREWENGKGLEWEVFSLPNGDFFRLSFGVKQDPQLEAESRDPLAKAIKQHMGLDSEELPTLWVNESKDSNFPVSTREATPAEIESFAIIANEEFPDSELTKQLTEYVVDRFKKVASSFTKKAISLEDKYL